MMSCYSIKQLNWKQYRDQLEFGIIEFYTRSQKYKILNHKYQLVYDTTKHKWGPEDYVKYESYFFTDKSDQTIEITPFIVAYYYVYYCKQNKIKVNESKIGNYIDRMQQPLISDSLNRKFRI